MALPSRPEWRTDHRGRIDGHFLGNHRCRSADCTHRRTLQRRPDPSGYHFRGECRTWLPDSTCGRESLSRLLPVQQTGSGTGARYAADVRHSSCRSPADYIRAVAYDRITSVAGTLIVNRTGVTIGTTSSPASGPRQLRETLS